MTLIEMHIMKYKNKTILTLTLVSSYMRRVKGLQSVFQTVCRGEGMQPLHK